MYSSSREIDLPIWDAPGPEMSPPLYPEFGNYSSDAITSIINNILPFAGKYLKLRITIVYKYYA